LHINSYAIDEDEINHIIQDDLVILSGTVIFKLNNMSVNDISISFKEGVKDLVGAAIVVGMAQGIILVLGDASPVNNSVLNTILNGMGSALSGLSSGFNAWFK
jgi:uncharacterized ion transporter superfamily protein YfcC